MEPSVSWLLGLVLSGAVAAVAYRRGSLAASGAWAALLVGTLIYASGGPAWFGALLAFFTTSSLLAKVGADRKAQTKREFSKSDTRDALQVLANGGVAAAAAALWLVSPQVSWSGAFLGALATANGDTWATELGTLSGSRPLSLIGFRRVARGTSGAVSMLGLLATAAGALLIGAIAATDASRFGSSPLLLMGIATFGGFTGAMLDSLLGATLQSRFHCPTCDVLTEGATHHCGSPTEPAGGLRWMDNDTVNLLATVGGAAAGAGALNLLAT